MRILRQPHIVGNQPPYVGRLTARHERNRDEITHRQCQHKDGANHDARLGQQNAHIPQNLHACGAAIPRGLYQRFIDPQHGVQDRHNHEERVSMHKGQQHRKVRKQQPFQRLINHPHRQQGRIGDGVAARIRNPRNHADDVGRPERHGENLGPRDLRGQRAHMKREERP